MTDYYKDMHILSDNVCVYHSTIIIQGKFPRKKAYSMIQLTLKHAESIKHRELTMFQSSLMNLILLITKLMLVMEIINVYLILLLQMTQNLQEELRKLRKLQMQQLIF